MKKITEGYNICILKYDGNNKVPGQDKNTNSTLVKTGQESYWGLFGIALMLIGVVTVASSLNKKYKGQNL